MSAGFGDMAAALAARADPRTALRAGAALLDAARHALRDSDPRAIEVELALEESVEESVERGEEPGVGGPDAPAGELAEQAVALLAAGDAAGALAFARAAVRRAGQGSAEGALASGALALALGAGAGPAECRRALARAREAAVAILRAIGHPRPEAHIDTLLWGMLEGSRR